MDTDAPSARLVIARGSVWELIDRTPHADCESVRLRGAQPHNAGTTRTLLAPFDRIVPLRSPQGWRVERPRTWLHALRRIALGCSPFGTLRAAAASRIELLPYQLEPALAIVRGLSTRLLIADDVGLGKTIQAGVILRELAGRIEGFRAIVLLPAALRAQWRDELRAHFDLESIAADTAWLASFARTVPGDVNPWGLPGIYLSSFDFVKRAEVLRPLEDVTWDLVIGDEAHAAAPGTDRRAAIHAVATRSRRVLLLTATPHSGDPQQFEALCAVGRIDGADAMPIVMFRRSRADARPASRRQILFSVRTSRAERRMHRLLEQYTTAIHAEAHGRTDALLAATVLRKRALSSAGSLLVSATRRRELLSGVATTGGLQLALPLGDEDPLDDAAPGDSLAAPGLSDVDREKRLLDDIVRAARMPARRETKASFLLRLLGRVREPVIVFTEYRDTLTRLAELVRAAGYTPLMLHGGMATAERMDAQRAFNDAGSLMLATDAASEGLNLHHRCRVVVHYELPWRPTRLQQRAGRVDRIGQHRRVHEIFLVAADTAERLVLAPLVRRSFDSRHATTAAARLFESLSESRVAAAVLAGMPLEPTASCTPPATADVTEIDLRAAAHRETARLREQRRWQSASQREARGGRRERVMTHLRRRRGHVAAVFVYRLTLRTTTGQHVHSELLPVLVNVEGLLAGRSTLKLRDAADGLEAAADPIVRERLDQGISRIVDATTAQHAALTATMAEREHAIASAIPSAARQLVQAGLFERRALRSSSQRRHVEEDLLSRAREHIDALSGSTLLTRSLELVALLLR